MIKEYESEQYDLEPQLEKSKKDLETFDQRSVDLRLLLKTVREQTDVRELTPALVNSLIERIEVHNNDKYDGHCHVKVDIYFITVGQTLRVLFIFYINLPLPTYTQLYHF